ncbi:hypothetical protein LOK49_LG11G01228 [Camellia lanceoleosa]|uniref:Uncharacterized protein n=1 Tax=Camellia lanceoleosa TaxID=1840588 RepID=A0ACC0G1D0_9ERIC|nr:hypothetical protein LOK49_LG11G01228 [Camellia lanceoleosa]
MSSCLSTSFTARISPPSEQCELHHRPSHLCRTSLILRPPLTHRALTSIVCMAGPYMITKLESVEKTWKELSVKLADPDVVSNNSEYQKLVQSMVDLDEVVSTFRAFKDCEKQLEKSKALAKEAVGDVDMAKMTASEIETLSNQLKELEEKLKALLFLSDPLDARNILLEGDNSMASAFPSGSHLNRWQRLIYSYILERLENYDDQDHHRSDIEYAVNNSQVFTQ